MNPRRYCLAFTLTVATAMSWAATLDGPRMGFVFDPGPRALRPILGIPGSAILGQPLELGIKLGKVAISPRQDYALVTTWEERKVALLVTGRSPAVPTAIDGVDAAPDEIVLSSSGQSAALYYKDRNRIQVLTGFPAKPQVSAEFYLSSGRLPAALAVSGDGSAVLAAMGESLYWISPSGEVPILNDLRKVTAIHFTDGLTALVADAARNQIHRVRDVTGTAAADVLAGPKDGISAPVALAVSQDNGRAFVANAKPGTVSILDLKGGTAVQHMSCGCMPTTLARLGNDDVFRLNEPSPRPMWVLDAGASRQPRILFIPADAPRRQEK